MNIDCTVYTGGSVNMETVHRGISEHGDWISEQGVSVNMETVHRGISEHGDCTRGDQ